MNEPAYCSELARAQRAPLYGTAVQVDLWLLVEYARPWRANAIEQSELPVAVRAHLEGLPAQVHTACGARLRVQFIKNARSRAASRPCVMLADGRQSGPRLIRTELDDYAGLANFAAAGLARGELPGGRALGQGVYLVCTNGQRDVCCARFGRPLYERLGEVFGERVWQTTHLGGHRYAPNLLCLPAGIVYGFVHPDEGVEVAQAFDRGLLSLRHLRGRASLPPVAQAAEYFLREAEGQHADDAFRLAGLRDNGELCHVSFVDAQGTRHELDVRVHHHAEHVVASCGAAPKAIDRFQLVGATVAQ